MIRLRPIKSEISMKKDEMTIPHLFRHCSLPSVSVPSFFWHLFATIRVLFCMVAPLVSHPQRSFSTKRFRAKCVKESMSRSEWSFSVGKRGDSITMYYRDNSRFIGSHSWNLATLLHWWAFSIRGFWWKNWSWMACETDLSAKKHHESKVALLCHVNTGDLPTPIHQPGEKTEWHLFFWPISFIGEVSMKVYELWHIGISPAVHLTLTRWRFTRRSRLHGCSEVAFQTHTFTCFIFTWYLWNYIHVQ